MSSYRVSINQPVRQTIRTVGIAPNVLASGISKLSQLTDVNVSLAVDGDVLTYDSATQKFVSQSVNIDGGTF